MTRSNKIGIDRKDINEMVERTVMNILKEWHDDEDVYYSEDSEPVSERIAMPYLYEEALRNGEEELAQEIDNEWSDFVRDEEAQNVGELNPNEVYINVKVYYNTEEVSGGPDISGSPYRIEFEEEDRYLERWQDFILEILENVIL